MLGILLFLSNTINAKITAFMSDPKQVLKLGVFYEQLAVRKTDKVYTQNGQKNHTLEYVLWL